MTITRMNMIQGDNTDNRAQGHKMKGAVIYSIVRGGQAARGAGKGRGWLQRDKRWWHGSNIFQDVQIFLTEIELRQT